MTETKLSEHEKDMLFPQIIRSVLEGYIAYVDNNVIPSIAKKIYMELKAFFK